MGEGFVMTFTSAVAAVSFAIDVQRTLPVHQSQWPERRRLRFRMGVDLGDIIADGGDVRGGGVTAASGLRRRTRRMSCTEQTGLPAHLRSPQQRFPADKRVMWTRLFMRALRRLPTPALAVPAAPTAAAPALALSSALPEKLSSVSSGSSIPASSAPIARSPKGAISSAISLILPAL